MKIAVLGHSLIHPRQQKFFQYIASLGHEVLAIAPGQWGTQRLKSYNQGSFYLETCRHMGGDHHANYSFLGAIELLKTFKADWVYIQQEPYSKQAHDVVKAGLPSKLALFTWENIVTPVPGGVGYEVLPACDLVVCGNDEAQRLVQPYARRTILALQVGVDTDHFTDRPIKRETTVGFVGRIAEEKGVNKLAIAWPTAAFLAWKPYLKLPWWYNQIQVVVNYSQDTPQWREQAPPYTAVEAMCCGCAVIVSNAGSIPFWMKKYAGECPGAIMVPQDNIVELKKAIQTLVDDAPRRTKMAEAGRSWVKGYLSTPVMANNLLEAFHAG